jgi:hypothetical protein
MKPPRRSTLLIAALVLATAALGAAGCGYESEHKDVVEGEPVELGDLTYNAIFSRYLNPDDTEDSEYLAGHPDPPPGSAYFGVFLEVQNDTGESHRVADHFKIVDAFEEEFEALESESPYAFPMGTELEEHEQIPILDSTGQTGPIEGSLVLFLLPDSASENRPLLLEVPGDEGPAEITLDL